MRKGTCVPSDPRDGLSHLLGKLSERPDLVDIQHFFSSDSLMYDMLLMAVHIGFLSALRYYFF
jgi:hypothetical protein